MGEQVKKLVLFDLDGVLIESRLNMSKTWEIVADEFGLQVSFENYFSNIGKPFRDILSVIGINKYQIEIEKRYNQVSSENSSLVEIFAGAQDYLSFLEQNEILLGIVTSKDKTRVKLILERFKNRFSIVRTPDGKCRGKPAPDHLLMASALANVDPLDVLFIGDMEVDSMAARRAGIDYAHASWGYGRCKQDDPQLTTFSDINQLIFRSMP